MTTKMLFLLVVAIASSSSAQLPSMFSNAVGNVTFDKVTTKVVTPSTFVASNDLATVTAVNSSNAVQDAAIGAKASTNVTAALTATNEAQDLLIGSKVGTNDMGSGLTFTNGQWIVTSQGTVTNIGVNAKAGTVSNGVATVELEASDVGAMSTNTPVELWTNPTSAATSPTNATLNGVAGVVSNSMIHLTYTPTVQDLGGYATTGSLFTVSNATAGLVADATLTNVVVIESNATSYAKVGRMAYVTIRTNAPGSDATQWATNAAVQTVNMAGYSLTNVGGLSVTGRLAIGFGVFTATNDVAPPASSNTWIIYAVNTGDVFRLMGVDYLTNRVWLTQ